ncbi:MBL fold metallo-hydrolase [Alteromonas oceanisediminis]|uniref:MBL fold metallo-hydrolase n=1 Tax=Alteromonas oceanisediminis TaxID=2836180 RepID=UPI001BDB611A|nr:MBL fold metallo-hydrolase [Alteromonas oceanisediminis]MBT0586088.1 MBL fold metallo-hydrolase [Alteromonas oceanisediminis]
MQLHQLNGYIQNILLVEYEHGLLLLDGCCRADVDSVARFITDELNRPLTDLKLVVVTHMHPDHAGGAHQLRRISGCRIACHPKAPRWYRGLMGKFAHLTDVGLTYWVAGRIGKPKKHIWYASTLRPDFVLDDEQTLPEFPDWQVLYTPGHTDHDLSLWHAESRQVYVADLVVFVKKRLVPPYPVCHPNQYKASLRRLEALAQPMVYFAHVKPRILRKTDIDEVIAKAPDLPKNHWHSSKARVKHALGLN